MEYNTKYIHKFINDEDKFELKVKNEISKDLELTVIGDIHGLYYELEALLAKEDFFIENNTISHENPNKKVCFVGDIIDRGEHSLKMLELVKNSIENNGHYMVIGNHENKLLTLATRYKNGEYTNSFAGSEAVTRTFNEFINLPIKKQDYFINFLKNLPFYHTYQDNLIVHANISNSNILTLSRDNCIYGDKKGNADLSFHTIKELSNGHYNLIRGHTTINDINDSVISLEQDAIDGGDLCMYNATNKEMFKEKCFFEYNKQSDLYKGRNLLHSFKKLEDYKIDKFDRTGEKNGTRNIPLVTYKENNTGTMRLMKYSKKVFHKNLWHLDPLISKARGLVLNSNGQICQHPFDKIFNYGENDSGVNIPNNQEVIAVEKLNGFLGNITLNNGKLLVTTTGSFDSDFVGYINDFITNKKFEHFNPKLQTTLIKFLIKNDLTLMFEVIHPADPHIIKYEDNEMGLKLIGARGKNFIDKELPEEALDLIGKEIGLERASWFKVPFGELKDIVKESNLEGYMVRDVETNNSLLKFKTPYYLVTKFIGRMSESNISFMYANKDKFKENIDEEYYDIIDEITSSITKEEFSSMENEEKIEKVRNIINDSRLNKEEIELTI